MIHEATPEELLGPLNAVEQKNAPKRLRYLGDSSLLHKQRVSIVGSRAAPDESLRRARRLASELVDADVVVVSGLAEGVDTAAHRAAIAEGGATIAVLGNGLEVHYPKANRDLQEVIASKHLLISQFRDQTPPRGAHFPQRNNLMALIAQATVVVASKERSGTVSQAWEAIRLGRPLFLMRSLVEDPKLEWCRVVIEHGAELLDDTSQILARIPPAVDQPLTQVAF